MSAGGVVTVTGLVAGMGLDEIGARSRHRIPSTAIIYRAIHSRAFDGWRQETCVRGTA